MMDVEEEGYEKDQAPDGIRVRLTNIECDTRAKNVLLAVLQARRSGRNSCLQRRDHNIL
jgi:hypothetical protein